MISAQDIANLRLKTGAGVMDCKNALEAAAGDFEKAKKILTSNTQAMAQKKAERTANQGLIEAYVHNGKIGVLLEIACESDFVARNSEFKELTRNLAMQVASMNPGDTAELLAQNYIRDEAITIKNLVEQATAKIGENIQIKRFTRYELGESHANN